MPETNPWTDIANLSIQAYDCSDSDTPTLSDETFIYANNKHTAIIVISFEAIDAAKNPVNSSDLPTAEGLKSSIKLLDYNTGQNLEETKPWEAVTNLDAFTIPIGAKAPDAKLREKTAELTESTYTFKFFVRTNAPDFSGINDVNEVNIGVKIDISKIVLGSDKIFKSCEGGDFSESCTLTPIKKYALPKDILVQEIVPVNCNDNGPPDYNSSELKQDKYQRIIHLAYHFDLSDTDDSDFQYNNTISRAEISLKDPPYEPNQPDSLNTSEDDPTGGSAANNALEPCCFLDQRDGLYSYKAYLWPACLMDIANSTKLSPPLLISDPIGEHEYKLFKDGFKTQYFKLNEIFIENNKFKFIDDTCIYITLYLTFGYMAQHYARGTYYKINIVDQYGNVLKVETNPAVCPQIFSPNQDSDQNGLHQFTDDENTPKWLSVPTDDTIKNYHIGDAKNLYFWLVSGGQNPNSILTYNYKTIGSNEIDSINFMPVSDYNNITFTPTLQAGFQTYRNLTDNTSIETAQYKLAFYNNGLSQTASLGIDQANSSYVLQTLPIYGTNKLATVEWQFCPIWENGTFIMWGYSTPDFTMQRTTLMNSETSPYYDIGAPNMGFEVAEFAALPAHRIENGVVKSDFLDGKFDTGINGPTNPYAAAGPDTARGDWSSVDALLMSWSQSNYSGFSIYRNGYHRGEISLSFNAMSIQDGSGDTQYCTQPPKPKFVQNSIDIIDYETGISILALNEGWEYEVFVHDPKDPNDRNPYNNYTAVMPQENFGAITTTINKNAGKIYNISVLIYISNHSSTPITKDRKFGVRFFINDIRWACPISVEFSEIQTAISIPLACRTVEPIQISSSAYDIQLNYKGDYNGNTDRDEQPYFSQIYQTNKSNCNRLWDLTISIKPTTVNNNKIIGWVNVNENEVIGKYNDLNKYGTLVGRYSNGIFHNEFILHDLGQFVNNDPSNMNVITSFPSDGSTKSSYYPVNFLIANYPSSTLTKDSDAFLTIKIVGSFLGESVFWSAFPSQSFQFIDLYGNRYDFSLDFAAIGMLYTNDEVVNLRNSNYPGFLTTGLNNTNKTVKDAIPALYYLSTTAKDHTIQIGNVNTGKSTADIKYGGPQSQYVIQFVNYGTSLMTNFSDSSFKIYLLFPRFHIENNDKGVYLGLEYNSIKKTFSSIDYAPSQAGYLGIDPHWITWLHPVWKNGKVCFSQSSGETLMIANCCLLSIIDPDNTGGGKVGLAQNGQDDYQFFTLSIEK